MSTSEMAGDDKWIEEHESHSLKSDIFCNANAGYLMCYNSMAEPGRRTTEGLTPSSKSVLSVVELHRTQDACTRPQRPCH